MRLDDSKKNVLTEKEVVRYFNSALEINSKVAKFLLSRFGTKKEMKEKEKYHFGIFEDLEANKMYENFLTRYCPEVGLYTEEGQRNLKNKLTFAIDPLEGTTNYANQIPFFATQIALVVGQKPILSIVNASALNEVFTARIGKGAFLNGKTINVSDTTDIARSVLDMGRGRSIKDRKWFVATQGKLLGKVKTNRTFGAASLDICFLAAGRTQIYINHGSDFYDLIPGAFIVREAGGVVLNFNGDDWKLGDYSFLASNSLLAKKVLKVI